MSQTATGDGGHSWAPPPPHLPRYNKPHTLPPCLLGVDTRRGRLLVCWATIRKLPHTLRGTSEGPELKSIHLHSWQPTGMEQPSTNEAIITAANTVENYTKLQQHPQVLGVSLTVRLCNCSQSFTYCKVTVRALNIVHSRYQSFTCICMVMRAHSSGLLWHKWYQIVKLRKPTLTYHAIPLSFIHQGP